MYRFLSFPVFLFLLPLHLSGAGKLPKQTHAVALLHYNRGFSLNQAGKKAEAKVALQQSARLNPKHANTHYLLGTVYADLGYRVPAVLALSRFLLIEPGSDRAHEAVATLNRLMSSGVAKGRQSNELSIILPPASESLKDEGDFGPAEFAISIGVAANEMATGRKKSSFDWLSTMYSVIGETAPTNESGFATTYYAPFFAEMEKRELVGAFVYRAFQAIGLEGAEQWEARNSTTVQTFNEWLAAYSWPAAR